ncbi:MAG: S24/S26 family peptidase [Fusicatenibacter sp.]|nr:S24/S26 family peptidase [Fusicatenibacter sp.]
MKLLDTRAYVSALRELTEQGREVSMTISGSSMSPFLIHQRDRILFRKPERELQVGDMVFYERDSGQFVMHRIRRIRPEGYYLIGDAQVVTEGPIRRDQIFAVVTRVQRKGQWIGPGDFWWEFFARVWIHLIPGRSLLIRLYGVFGRHQ